MWQGKALGAQRDRGHMDRLALVWPYSQRWSGIPACWTHIVCFMRKIKRKTMRKIVRKIMRTKVPGDHNARCTQRMMCPKILAGVCL